MPVTLSMKWDDHEMVKAGDITKATLKSLRNAGDRAARKLMTDAVKYVQTRKRLKSTFIRKGMSVQRPGQSSSIDQLAWTLRVSGAAVPLAQYGSTAFKGSKKKGEGGVKVRINPGKATKLKSAFRQTLDSGHVGIFQRKGKARFPIKQLMSMPLSQIIGADPSAVDKLFEPAREAMTAAFTAAMAELGAK